MSFRAACPVGKCPLVSTRDIEAHLVEIYGVKVGRDLISSVTDAVLHDVRAWQQRPLDDVYPVIFWTALC
jgi:putative transposase